MILSDVDIRKQVASGRVVIDPFDENAVQPSSVDLCVDRWFRVFANSRHPVHRRQEADGGSHGVG